MRTASRAERTMHAEDQTQESAEVSAGTGPIRRFSAEAWVHNPALKRTLQSYLAVGEAARGLMDDAGLQWGDDQRMRSIVDNLVDAFDVGRDIAVTPGAEVLRTDVFELLQHTPRKPPRSALFGAAAFAGGAKRAPWPAGVLHLLAQPGVRHADWGLDTYGQGILEAAGAPARAEGHVHPATAPRPRLCR